jgi:hypothetical protein
MVRRKHMWDWLVIMMPLMLLTKLASSKPMVLYILCNSMVHSIWEKKMFMFLVLFFKHSFVRHFFIFLYCCVHLQNLSLKPPPNVIGQVVNTHVSYLESPGLTSQPADWPPWWRFFVVFLSPTRKMWSSTLSEATATSFYILSISLFTLSFDVTQSQVLTAT